MIGRPIVKFFLLAFLLSAVAFSGGCAVLGLGADPAGYGTKGLSYEGVDFTVLRGKTIVLDPGHGGRYLGAVGKGGLTEKEVNLAVAKILRDLLVSYGATVVMTRSEDVDLLPESTEEPVRADLQSRMDSANTAVDAVFFSPSTTTARVCRTGDTTPPRPTIKWGIRVPHWTWPATFTAI